LSKTNPSPQINDIPVIQPEKPMIKPPFATGKKGIELIHSFENCAEKKNDGWIYPYRCPVGIPTIGWGNTYYPDGKRVTMEDKPITQQQADELFKTILYKFEDSVNYLITSKVNQNMFDACIVFSYNCGRGAFAESTLLKRINNNPLDPTIRDAFMMWVDGTVDGKLVKLLGLVRRRKDEADLYFTKMENV
jgi:lysozyme